MSHPLTHTHSHSYTHSHTHTARSHTLTHTYTHPHTPPPPTHTARSDRYSHDFASDEEDGVDDDTFQQAFENFSSVAPRFSHLLEDYKLTFDEPSPSTTPTEEVQKRHSKVILEPKHEKRDSGIAGIDESTAPSDSLKILEGEKQCNLLTPSVVACSELAQDDVNSSGDKDDENEGETTDDEDEAEGVITLIDEVRHVTVYGYM